MAAAIFCAFLRTCTLPSVFQRVAQAAPGSESPGGFPGGVCHWVQLRPSKLIPSAVANGCVLRSTPDDHEALCSFRAIAEINFMLQPFATRPFLAPLGQGVCFTLLCKTHIVVHT